MKVVGLQSHRYCCYLKDVVELVSMHSVSSSTYGLAIDD